LLPDSVKDDDTTGGLKGCLDYSEWREGNGDLNTYLKGNAMWIDDDSLEIRSLEMRINIER